MPKIEVGAPSCRTAITAEKEQRILQVCRNLNTRSALLVKCSKALIISNIVLLMIILGSLFRQVSLLLSCCRLREMEYFHYQSEKCYIWAIICTERGSVAASVSEQLNIISLFAFSHIAVSTWLSIIVCEDFMQNAKWFIMNLSVRNNIEPKIFFRTYFKLMILNSNKG